MRPNPAAILLGGLANAVSVARALALEGVPVYALGAGSWDAVEHSRACREYFRADGLDVQAAWLRWLERNHRRLDGAVLLPCGDDGVELIARNRRLLVELGFRPFEANDEVLRAMLHKGRTYELARAAGVPTPRAIDLADVEDPIAAVTELGFPCALKPVHSHVFARAGLGKAIAVHDPDEAQRALGSFNGTGVAILATEIVPGGVDQLMSYYTYLDDQGAPVFHATKRKLRQFPLDFGVQSYGVTQWDPELAELGYRFFSAIGLRGLAEAEFKRDAGDGKLKLIECNHRFTGSHELLRRAGINLALLTYNRTLGRPDPSLGPYRNGVYLWAPILDTHAYRSLRQRREISPVTWLRSILHRQHFPVFDWRDPKPALVDVARRAYLLLSETFRASRARS